MTKLLWLVGFCVTAVFGAESTPAPEACPPSNAADIVKVLECVHDALEQEQYPTAQQWLQQAVRLAEPLPPEHVAHYRLLSQFASFAQSQGNLPAITDLYRGALARLDKRVDADHPSRIDLLVAIGQAISESDSSKAAIPYVREAVRIAALHTDADGGRDRLAAALRRLAVHQENAADPGGAIASLRSIAELYEWKPDTRWVGAADDLARLELQQNHPDEAAQAFEIAIVAYSDRFGLASSRGQVLVDQFSKLGTRLDRTDIIKRARSQRAALRKEKPQPRTPVVPEVVHDWRSGILSQARTVMKFQPEYPVEARIERASGEIELDAIILADGTMGGVEIVRCSKRGYGFEEASSKAVGEWMFEPATLDGVPVATRFHVVVKMTIR